LPATTRQQVIEAPLERLRYLRELERRAARIKRGVARYYHDPVAFAADCIDWRDEPGLAPYQAEVLGELPGRKRECIRAPHGVGKSLCAGVVILWFALTRDAAGVDWKIPTTAGSWHQLTQYLWPEIHKWAGRLRWDKVRDGRPFTRAELQNLNLRLTHGAAFAGASKNAALIEGAHATELLFVFDEGKAIPAGTFDACEGAFSTGTAYALVLSTPGAPAGRFYDICTRKPGYEDWYPRHISLEEAIAAGRINPDWAEQRLRQWGPESAIYVNRVLGEFHAGDEESAIPLAWAEAAVERWHEWDLGGRAGIDAEWPRTVGVDVARYGSDKTVLAIRSGPVLIELRRSSKEDTMRTTGRVKGVLDADAGRTAIVDVIGIGAGVVDRLREQNAKVLAFNGAAGTKLRDSTGEFGYQNIRSAAYWGMREQLDPSAGSDICLPDDDLLLGDLTAPQWRITSSGNIAVESKDDVVERLGRSPDDGDATVEAFWPRLRPHQRSARSYALHTDLEQMTRDPSQRLRDRLARGDGSNGHEPDGWDDPDTWAPLDDDGEVGRPTRRNVRNWS
jgi:hypothetical protein